MNIDCISDLHGHYPELEGGDLLIVAGDLTASDRYTEYEALEKWLRDQKYKMKIVVAGNHDNKLYSTEYFLDFQGSGIFYLCDSGTEFQYWEDEPQDVGNLLSVSLKKPIRKVLKIWGSPWTLAFEGMNPKCKAFTCETEEELEEKWALIPDDIDILVTHSPPWGVLDEIEVFDQEKMGHAGSKTLMETMISRKKPPKLWVWGHIHEAYGERTINSCKMVNASHVNEHYQPVNKPIRVIL